MLPDYLVMLFSTTPLIVLLLINLYNVTRKRASRGPSKPSSISPQEGSYIYLASFGTFAFAADSILFPFIILTGFLPYLNSHPFRISFACDSVVQLAGLVLLIIGYSVFAWSVVARGQYAVSWNMPENHRLVTWGPYHYVRHPSYLGYMLMFFGITLTWLNVLAVPCLIGIPGYYGIIDNEEKLLIQKFGDEYRLYRARTGKLFPSLRKK